MYSLLTFLIGAIFNLLKSKKELLIQIYLHKKELEILKRQNQKGIDQRVPMGYKPQLHGKVLKFPILGGLCSH